MEQGVRLTARAECDREKACQVQAFFFLYTLAVFPALVAASLKNLQDHPDDRSFPQSIVTVR